MSLFLAFLSLAAANPCGATECPVALEISAALETQQQAMEIQLASGEYSAALASSSALASAARAAEADGALGSDETLDLLRGSWAAWDIARDAADAEASLDEGEFDEAMDAAHRAANRVRADSALSEATRASLLARLGSLWERARGGDSLTGQKREMEGQLAGEEYVAVLGSSRALADAARAALSAGSIDEERADALLKSAWAAWNTASEALDAQASSSSGDALATPIINQNHSGSYPGGYCAIAALRMVLRYEGLSDPGADAVALYGSRPYIPGAGSDPTLLARRARELGLGDAQFDNAGRLSDVTAMLDAGKPVMVGGEGTVRGTFEDGQYYAKTYYSSGHWMTVVGYERDASGDVSRVILNDPNTGRRLTTSESQFLSFFAPDGNIWMIGY